MSCSGGLSTAGKLYPRFRRALLWLSKWRFPERLRTIFPEPVVRNRL